MKMYELIKKQKAIVCWSGGKDSAMALYRTLQDDIYEVVALLTTFNSTYKRVSMHGIREDLLDEQAKAIDFPLIKMYVNDGSNATYEKEMETILLKCKLQGVTKIIFGDIFLEDLRAYREKKLQQLNLEAVFPLWKADTKKLMEQFFILGFKTITCCVNDAYFNRDAVGIQLTKKFINELPKNVDPCGERGEYHTFCYSGPIFKNEMNVLIGEKIYRLLEIKENNDICSSNNVTTGFWFCELINNNL